MPSASRIFVITTLTWNKKAPVSQMRDGAEYYCLRNLGTAPSLPRAMMYVVANEGKRVKGASRRYAREYLSGFVNAVEAIKIGIRKRLLKPA